MLPVVDEFRNASKVHPATTERETNMHKSFGPLLDGILTVFKKFGYNEFAPTVGDKYDGQKHEAVGVVAGEVDGLVVEVIKSGFADKEDNTVLRYVNINMYFISTVYLTNTYHNM